MQIGQGKSGMQTMNQSLATLYIRKQITLEEAIGHSSDPDELQEIIATGNQLPPGRGGGPAGGRAPDGRGKG
jgi:twitching motility protein PilT